MNGQHAIVLGGSIGGLLAARVLTEAYEKVTIVERDRLDPDTGTRRGVPQSRHLHALLPRGTQELDILLPGLTAELTAAGAPTCRMSRQVHWSIAGGTLPRTDTASFITPSRGLLEQTIRARVLALPQVTLIDECDVAGIVADEACGRISGARIVRRIAGSTEEVLDGDLVVDATGRGSRTPVWLESLGYDRPTEHRLKVGVQYATRLVKLPADALGGDLVVLVGAHPGQPRGMAMLAQEDDQWIITLGGFGGQQLPTDDAGFLAHVAAVAPPHVHAAITAAQPLSDVTHYRIPTVQWLRYDRLSRFPEGLLVIGDAICSFNPIYAQGITVSALEASALRDCLRHGENRLAQRFFRAAARALEPAWQMAASSDLTFPETEGERPLALRLSQSWAARVQRAAHHDPVVAATFIKVTGLLEPPTALLGPGMVTRVLTRRFRNPVETS